VAKRLDSSSAAATLSIAGTAGIRGTADTNEVWEDANADREKRVADLKDELH